MAQQEEIISLETQHKGTPTQEPQLRLNAEVSKLKLVEETQVLRKLRVIDNGHLSIRISQINA